MLVKLIFLLQVTMSLQGEKAKKIRAIRKSGRIRRGKILHRLKKGPKIDKLRNKSLGLEGLFESLKRVRDFYRPTPFDTLALFTFVLFLLKKLLLLSILVICKILHSLIYEDINGN